jgi:PST family polysaccharide transporter
VFSFFLFIVLSRHFGPDGVGQYAFGLAIAGLAYAAVHLGLEDYAIRECARLSISAKRAVLGRTVAIQCISTVGVFASIIVFLLLSNTSTQKTIIVLLLSGHQIAFALARTLFSPALAEQRMKAPALAEFLCRLGIISLSIVLVSVLEASLVIALVPFLVGGVLFLTTALASAVRNLGSINLYVSWKESLTTVRIAWPFGASVLVFSLRWYGIILVVAFLLGDYATGIFSSSLKFLQVSAMPLFFIGLAAYPQLSQFVEHREPRIVEALDRLVQLTLTLAVLVSWGLFFLVPLVVVPLLGDRFAPAIPVIQAMAMLPVLWGLANMLIRQLMALHLQTQYLKIYLSAFLLTLLLTIALLPIMGIMGAVVASIISGSVANVFYLRLCQRHLGTHVLARNVIWFIISIMPVVLVAGGLMQLSFHIWTTAIMSLMVLICSLWLAGFLKNARDLHSIAATTTGDPPIKRPNLR